MKRASIRPLARLSALVLTVGVAIAGPASVANAASPGAGAAGGSGDAGPWPLSVNDTPAARAAIAKFQASAQGSPTMLSTGLAAATVCPPGAGTCFPANLTLSVPWQRQINGYYCGPATVSMASFYYGSNRSQNDVAARYGIGTAGSDRNQIQAGLNWVSNSTAYIQIAAPSSTTLYGALRSSIGTDGRPMGVNTHETDARGHYNAHHSGDIGHFILAVGYISSGTGVYNDPASGLSGYTNSLQQFQLASTSMAVFLTDRGIIPG